MKCRPNKVCKISYSEGGLRMLGNIKFKAKMAVGLVMAVSVLAAIACASDEAAAPAAPQQPAAAAAPVGASAAPAAPMAGAPAPQKPAAALPAASAAAPVLSDEPVSFVLGYPDSRVSLDAATGDNTCWYVSVFAGALPPETEPV